MDKRLEGNHKCHPDVGHDERCICLRMRAVLVRNYHIHTRPTENVAMITFFNFLNSENKVAIPLPVLTIKK